MSARPDPFYLEANGRKLFAVWHLPAGPIVGNVLCLPSFNEEMNRCRSMVSLQAQALARQGLATLVLDPYGTGDSEGEHGDASWQGWLDDALAACDWLASRGGLNVLWGIRSGALLAAQASRQLAEPVPALLLWQPACDGKQLFTQFLRLRVAAQMERSHLEKETTASLRARLEQGQPIEVAGYEIAPALGLALDDQRLDVALPRAGRVCWLEQRVGEADDVSPASTRVIAAWREQGLQVQTACFAGPPFWQVHERAVAPELISMTEELMARHVTELPA
jgi:exosortase A-associated hydrolase 2